MAKLRCANVIPLGDGIIAGVQFDCPKHPGRVHAVNFMPPINPFAKNMPDVAALMEKALVAATAGRFHRRISGETLDTLTLAPSVGCAAGWLPGKPECCHGVIINGEFRGS